MTVLLLGTFLFNANAQGGTELFGSSGTPLQSSESEVKYADLPDELKQKMAKFFEGLVQGEIADAYDKLLDNSPIKRKKANLSSLIASTERSVELYGNIFDYEPVNVDMVTTSFFKVRYLTLHTTVPTRWIFTYYHSPDKGWIITNILFDDQSENLFYDND